MAKDYGEDDTDGFMGDIHKLLTRMAHDSFVRKRGLSAYIELEELQQLARAALAHYYPSLTGPRRGC